MFASAAPKATNDIPKRAVFMGIGFGVTKETWYPDLKDTGAGYKLTEGLAPLARHKKDFTVVQGCSNQYSNEAHWGSTFWLTGANRYSVPGQNMANSISVDQVIAQNLGGTPALLPCSWIVVMAALRGMGRACLWLGINAANLWQV